MKRERFGPGAWLVVLLLVALFHANAWALTDEEIFRDFRFNFINPGARSLGLGGAFIAAADDATAIQANPAAMHYIFYKEFFVEYRHSAPETQFFFPDRPSGSLDPNNPRLPYLDAQAVNDKQDTNTPSFASFAYPFRLGNRRATVAGSRQVVLDVRSSLQDDSSNVGTSLRFSTDQFPVWVNPGNTGCGIMGVQQYAVCNKVTGDLDTELVNYNIGFSVSITDDFSIGVTATYANLDMTSSVESTSLDPRGALFSTHPRIDTGGGNLSPIRTRSFIDDSDNAFSWTVGLHWHPDRVFASGYSPIRFGLVYRKGADLSVEETVSEFDATTGRFIPERPFANTLRVPDRYGIGVSYETEKYWTFSVDVERIEYSDLLEGFRSGENFFTSDTLAKVLDPNAGDLNLEYDVDDATVVHAGVQFKFRSQGSWTHAVRAGYYNAPDNRIRLTDVDSGDPQLDRLYRDVFRGADSENHYTVGLSIGTPILLEIQLAGDFADTGDEYVASVIYRFGEGR